MPFLKCFLQHGGHHHGGHHSNGGDHMNNGGSAADGSGGQLDLSMGGANHEDYKRYSHQGALLHHAAAAAAVEIKPNRW